MPGTKPVAPYLAWFKTENTSFTWEVPTFATDGIRLLGVPDIGVANRVRDVVNVSRPDRGRFLSETGMYINVPFTFTIPFISNGTAGVPVNARKALYEAAGLDETDFGTNITYTLSDNPAYTMSAYIVDRAGVQGEYLEGCIVQSIAAEFSKESTPQFTFTGIAARKYTFIKTTLDGALTDVATTAVFDDDCIHTGSTSDSETGLELYAIIESEVIKITDYVHSTKTATIVRGAFSTTNVAHSDALAVGAYKPAFVGAAGTMLDRCSWDFEINSVSTPVLNITWNFNTGREFDSLQSDSCSSNSVHNNKIDVTGQLTLIDKNTEDTIRHAMSNKTLLTDLKMLAGTIDTTFYLEVHSPNVQITEATINRDESGVPQTVQYSFRALDESDYSSLDQIAFTES